MLPYICIVVRGQVINGEGWDPIYRLNPASFFCLSQARTCPCGFVYVQWFEVRVSYSFCCLWWNCFFYHHYLSFISHSALRFTTRWEEKWIPHGQFMTWQLVYSNFWTNKSCFRLLCTFLVAELLYVFNFSHSTFYWNSCTKPGKWAIIYICLRVINFASVSMIFLLDFAIFFVFFVLYSFRYYFKVYWLVSYQSVFKTTFTNLIKTVINMIKDGILQFYVSKLQLSSIHRKTNLIPLDQFPFK